MLIFQEADVTNVVVRLLRALRTVQFFQIIASASSSLGKGCAVLQTLSDVIVERDLVHTCASFVPTPRLMPMPMPIGDTSARHLSSADHFSPATPDHRCCHCILLVYCYKHVADRDRGP